tara:strand:+ start:145 stop:357 length:213 start_codon:yes stop_codon:yes gene_type:complete
MGKKALVRRLKRQARSGKGLKVRTLQRLLKKGRIEEPKEPPPPKPVRQWVSKGGSIRAKLSSGGPVAKAN